MSRDYRRAKKNYSFYAQRKIIVDGGSPAGSLADATRMRKTYHSNRAGGGGSVVSSLPLLTESLLTETSEQLLTESGENLVTES